ncbi:MAG: TIGR03936 family radical SAM-associated protein [Anaerolineaceae bacterium]
MKKQPPHQQSACEPKARMRLTYATGGAIRYTGNLDLHRIWERAFRRARLPISYSNGFHPQPRLQLACALPLGMVSRQELADIWLNEVISPDRLREEMNKSLPVGVRITKVEEVDLKERPLQTRIQTAAYQVILDPPPSQVKLLEAIDSLLISAEIMRERRGKIYNLRPLIEKIEAAPFPDEPLQPSLIMVLAAREGATGRPEEVLSAMGIDPQIATIERTALSYE